MFYPYFGRKEKSNCFFHANVLNLFGENAMQFCLKYNKLWLAVFLYFALMGRCMFVYFYAFQILIYLHFIWLSVSETIWSIWRLFNFVFIQLYCDCCVFQFYLFFKNVRNFFHGFDINGFCHFIWTFSCKWKWFHSLLTLPSFTLVDSWLFVFFFRIFSIRIIKEWTLLSEDFWLLKKK